jgi:xanthine dehydrogenase accessory factor
LYPVTPEDAGAIWQIINCLQQNKNGSLQLSPAGLQVTEDRIPDTDHRFSMQSESDWVYEEKLGYKHRLLVIGGGHCALALCRIMSQMDFYIQVFDDRADLPTLEQNIYAHETNIVHDYQELQQRISSGNNCYVVVMTVGYRTDDVTIRALLGKSFRYMGILGSKAKIDQLFTTYRQDGVPEETLLRMHAPIGLSIKSETPEEIAVSIAAEIIQAKNTKQSPASGW